MSFNPLIVDSFGVENEISNSNLESFESDFGGTLFLSLLADYHQKKQLDIENAQSRLEKHEIENDPIYIASDRTFAALMYINSTFLKSAPYIAFRIYEKALLDAQFKNSHLNLNSNPNSILVSGAGTIIDESWAILDNRTSFNGQKLNNPKRIIISEPYLDSYYRDEDHRIKAFKTLLPAEIANRYTLEQNASARSVISITKDSHQSLITHFGNIKRTFDSINLFRLEPLSLIPSLNGKLEREISDAEINEFISELFKFSHIANSQTQITLTFGLGQNDGFGALTRAKISEKLLRVFEVAEVPYVVYSPMSDLEERIKELSMSGKKEVANPLIDMMVGQMSKSTEDHYSRISMMGFKFLSPREKHKKAIFKELGLE